MAVLWQHTKKNPDLIPNEIHIWAADLRLSAEQLSLYRETLSTEELTRADRFKFEIHRNRFIAAKGILRDLLSNYLNIPAKGIQFILGAHGKPYLAKEISPHLFFNSSDSHDLALYAFTLNNEVGIDVEFMRDNIDPIAIAERFFSPHEKQKLAQLPQEQKKLGFFNCWTRKEAVIKALGLGLSFHLDKFDVSLTPGEEAKLIRIEDAEETVVGWNLYHLEPATNYIAALAIKKETETTLRCFRFSQIN